MAQLEKKHFRQSLLQFLLAAALLVLVNVLANSRLGDLPLYGALDLTEDKLYSLTDNTVEQLEAIEDPIFVRVLLDGDLPLEYQLLKNKVEELMLEFQDINPNLEWEFANPLAGGSPEDIQQRQRDLQETFNIVSFLTGRLPGISEATRLNQAENLLEYNLSRGIQSITSNDKPLVGFTRGNGELPGPNFIDIYRTLAEDYTPTPVYLDSFATIPQDIAVLIVAKPTEPFSDFDAFKLDQYVMNGGKIIWALDAVAMDYDSLQGRNEYYPQPRELGLDNLLFKYGVRLGPVPFPTT